MPNRAERRARRRWQMDGPADPIQAAHERLVCLSASFLALQRSVEAVAARFASGTVSPAEVEAVNRWALPAGSAFARAADDLDRLGARLRQAAGVETGD